MRKATENDTGLMVEVLESFWIEPDLHISLLNEDDVSYIAIGVLQWLQVRLIFFRPLRTHSNQFPMTVFLLFRRFMTHQGK